MSTITGEVEAKAKTGRSILVNAVWYGAFASATLDGVERGDTVTFESVLDKTGKYNNIKGVVQKVRGTATSPLADGTFKVLKPSLDRERCIIRQNALHNSVLFVGDHVEEPSPERIIEVARIFEAYTSGDMDLEAAKKVVNDMEVE